jgi:hypothetical protein
MHQKQPPAKIATSSPGDAIAFPIGMLTEEAERAALELTPSLEARRSMLDATRNIEHVSRRL